MRSQQDWTMWLDRSEARRPLQPWRRAAYRQSRPACHPSGSQTHREGQPGPPMPGPSPVLLPAPPQSSDQGRAQSAVFRHCCRVGVGSSGYGGHTAWPDRGSELGLTPSTIPCQSDYYSSGWKPGSVGPRPTLVLIFCLGSLLTHQQA